VKKILVHRVGQRPATIEQLPAARDWMDETAEKHAYMCFPMTLTNRLGWGVSFPEDISFIWDGVQDTDPSHVTILQGEKYAYTGRAHGTVSFYTGLIVKTDENTSMLSMPVPNLFIRGIQGFTTLMSTSFYMSELPLAVKITEPNKEITIPANTPVASLLPISLGSLQSDYSMDVIENGLPQEYFDEIRKYGDAAEIKNGVGDWSKMYRDAVDYRGETVGKHETKSIRLKTVTCPVTGNSYEVKDESN